MAFQVNGTDADGPLTIADSVAGDTWHTRAAAHPDGRTVYLASHVPVRGIFISAFRFNPESCTFGPRISHVAPTRDTAESKRFYGVEVTPDGGFLFQTTEVVGTIRSLRVADDGSLAQHAVLPGMDGGIFDPVLHPSGRWLYQPVHTNDSTAPEGPGMYIARFEAGPDGMLGDLHTQRIDDPDRNGPGPERASTFDGVYVSTLLFHPGGRTAYLTTANVPDERSWVLVADLDPTTGALAVRERVAVSDPTGVHHGGALVPDGQGGLLLATFVTDYELGRLEVMRVTDDEGLQPADPPAVLTPLRDTRHPMVVQGR